MITTCTSLSNIHSIAKITRCVACTLCYVLALMFATSCSSSQHATSHYHSTQTYHEPNNFDRHQYHGHSFESFVLEVIVVGAILIIPPVIEAIGEAIDEIFVWIGFKNQRSTNLRQFN